MNEKINKKIEVKIWKCTTGSDGNIYITVRHPLASNYPSLILKKGVNLKDLIES